MEGCLCVSVGVRGLARWCCFPLSFPLRKRSVLHSFIFNIQVESTINLAEVENFFFCGIPINFKSLTICFPSFSQLRLQVLSKPNSNIPWNVFQSKITHIFLCPCVLISKTKYSPAKCCVLSQFSVQLDQKFSDCIRWLFVAWNTEGNYLMSPTPKLEEKSQPNPNR